MALRITLLGAGRQVGRSCVLLEIAGSRVLLDCGVNAGARGPEHAPEFAKLAADGRDMARAVDVVIITHFHLDHVGALPYFTEVLGYEGPILMTHPTRAIAPVVLEDYVKLGEGKGQALYTMDMIGACFERVSCFQLQERRTIGEIVVTPFYAGHVLGAVMLLVECQGRSAFYTGDFTMVPDHHLSAASAPLSMRPDVMISETTYCTTIRSSKRQKEQDLCRKIQDALDAGGKVLVPVFMMGRAQELCLLCEKHWARARLNYPIYIVRGMAEKALNFFRLFSSWSSELVRKADSPFNFPHVKMCEVQEVVDLDTPMVVFAGPSMLNGGPSLRIFKQWAPDTRNLVILAGYCLVGTIGNSVLAKQKKISLSDGEVVDVRCSVDYMSHSDHSDARGILQLTVQVAPRHVVLVHGPEGQMRTFKHIVEQRFHLPCSDPPVGETLDLSGEQESEVLVSPSLLLHAQPLPAPPVPPMGAFRHPKRVEDEEVLEAALPSEGPCVAFAGLLRKRARGAEAPGEAPSWELLDRSSGGVAAAKLPLHRLRYRHEVRLLPLASFRKAWSALELELRRLAAEASWAPAELPRDGPLQHGCSYKVTLLTATSCQLQAAQASDVTAVSQGDLVDAIVQWVREDAHHAAVAQFLEALGA